jgi:hypothetical protein
MTFGARKCQFARLLSARKGNLRARDERQSGETNGTWECRLSRSEKLIVCHVRDKWLLMHAYNLTAQTAA